MLATNLPDIVFVPGFWEGASVYDKCSELLRKVGYTVYVASLLSTGTSFTETPKSPSLADDVARIRSLIEQLVNLEHELILVCHSAGGFLGSHAIEGLSASARKRNGLNGGVLRLAFLAGAVFPEGTFHEDLWFFDIEVRFSRQKQYMRNKHLLTKFRVISYSANRQGSFYSTT